MTELAPLARAFAPAAPAAAVHSKMGGYSEQSFAPFASSCLSEREAEVVLMVLRGHTNKAIARVLGCSPETLKVHRKRSYTKAGLTSQGEFFRFSWLRCVVRRLGLTSTQGSFFHLIFIPVLND